MASDPKNLAIDESKINYRKPSKPPRATLKMPARSDISPAIIGPVESTKTSEQMFLCSECDKNTCEMVLEEWAEDMDHTRERTCAKEWLTGKLLSIDDDGQSTACDCFQSDPFPAAEWPGMKNINRRYFYYKAIAKLLGAKGKYNRVKLPACVYQKIDELHPRTADGPAKVGFKRVRSE